MSKMKKCATCGVEYPETKDYFYFRTRSGKDSFGINCKVCARHNSNSRYHDVVKFDNSKKKELEGPKNRTTKCKLFPYSKELNTYIKTCPKCRRELPATTEYFNNNKAGKNGLSGHCKECRGHHFTRIPKEGYIICYKCKEELQANEENFLPRNDSITGFRGVCRKCRSIQEANFRLENIEVMRERDRQQDIKRRDSKKEYAYQRYWSDPEFASKISRKSRIKHIEKRRSESRMRYILNKEESKAYARKYRKTKSGKASITKTKQKRRAARINLANDFTVEQWNACKEYFGNVCAYCGRKTMIGHDLDQDHFIASSNGGPYTASNIVCACRKCNSKKHTSEPIEWFRKQTFYSLEREKKILTYLNISSVPPIQQLTFSI